MLGMYGYVWRRMLRKKPLGKRRRRRRPRKKVIDTVRKDM